MAGRSFLVRLEWRPFYYIDCCGAVFAALGISCTFIFSDLRHLHGWRGIAGAGRRPHGDGLRRQRLSADEHPASRSRASASSRATGSSSWGSSPMSSWSATRSPAAIRSSRRSSTRACLMYPAPVAGRERAAGRWCWPWRAPTARRRPPAAGLDPRRCRPQAGLSGRWRAQELRRVGALGETPFFVIEADEYDTASATSAPSSSITARAPRSSTTWSSITRTSLLIWRRSRRSSTIWRVSCRSPADRRQRARRSLCSG